MNKNVCNNSANIYRSGSRSPHLVRSEGRSDSRAGAARGARVRSRAVVSSVPGPGRARGPGSGSGAARGPVLGPRVLRPAAPAAWRACNGDTVTRGQGSYSSCLLSRVAPPQQTEENLCHKTVGGETAVNVWRRLMFSHKIN